MRDNSVPVNPVKSDEQRKTSQECRARRCCLPCGPAKSTTGVKAKTSAPPHSAPHLRGLDIPWCVTSNPPGGDAERAAADGRHSTAGLTHGRQDGGPRGLSGDSSSKAPCPPDLVVLRALLLCFKTSLQLSTFSHQCLPRGAPLIHLSLFLGDLRLHLRQSRMQVLCRVRRGTQRNLLVEVKGRTGKHGRWQYL